MPRYTLSLLGLEISFRTDADKERIELAQEQIEERYAALTQGGTGVSKEKVLICLALSLADDYLQAETKLGALEKKIGFMLSQGDEEP